MVVIHDYMNSCHSQRRSAPIAVGCWHWYVPGRGEEVVAPSEQIDYGRDRDYGCDRVHVRQAE